MGTGDTMTQKHSTGCTEVGVVQKLAGHGAAPGTAGGGGGGGVVGVSKERKLVEASGVGAV